MRTNFGLFPLALSLVVVSLPVDAAVDVEAFLADVERVGKAKIDRDKLVAGEVIRITSGATEVEKAQIASAAFLYVPAPLSDIREVLEAGRPYTRGTTVAEQLEGPDATVTVVGTKTPLGDRDLRTLENVKPGDKLNLSAEEIRWLQGKDPNHPQATQDFQATFNEILTERYRAYRDKGASGVAPYQRSRTKQYLPSEALIEGSKSAEVLQEYFPEFFDTLVNYPQVEGPGVVDRFYALEQEVEKRRQFVLNHWFVSSADDHVLVAQRHYYVSHTYNVLQLIFIALPYRDGTLIGMLNQTFTEQVTGLTAGVAHKIGRGMIADEIEKSFEWLQEAVSE